MKLFLYKLLTQFIIILSVLRKKLKLQYVIRKDRTFITKEPKEESICCDCGLSHMVIYDYDNQVTRWRPIRPEGYDYSFRRYADKPSLQTDESDT